MIHALFGPRGKIAMIISNLTLASLVFVHVSFTGVD